MGSQQLSLVFPILLIVIFYFLLIRPQKKREKKINTMRSSLNIGDKVVTIGGFSGKVKKVKDDIVTLEIKPDNVKLEVTRWAISSNESQVEEVVQPKKAVKKADKKEEKAIEIDPSEVVEAEVIDETTTEKE